jgi:hypothetical protein
MADTNDKPERDDAPAATMRAGAPAREDARKPYEAPRLLKKRSVARATLFTVTGVMMSGLTTHG